MSSEEVFQVLQNSNLYRGYWFYQSWLPDVIWWLSLVFIAIIGGYTYFSTNELRRNIRNIRSLLNPFFNERGDIRRIPSVPGTQYIYFIMLIASVLGLFGIKAARDIKHGNVDFLFPQNTGIDSLYAMPPSGVQAIVDYLFWISILTEITFILIGATSLVIIVIASTRKCGELYVNKKLNLMLFSCSVCALIIIFILAVLFSSFCIFNNEKPSSSDPSCQCHSNESDVLTWRVRWEEWGVKDNGERVAKIGLERIDNENQVVDNGISCAIILAFGKESTCSTKHLFPDPEDTKADILIIPEFNGDRDELRVGYYSLLLLEFLGGCHSDQINCIKLMNTFEYGNTNEEIERFHLGPGRDRVFLLGHSDYHDQYRPIYYQEEVANIIFKEISKNNNFSKYTQLSTKNVISSWIRQIDKYDKSEANVGNRVKIVIIIRWRPNNSDIIYSVINDINRDKYNLWVIDIFPSAKVIKDNMERSDIDEYISFMPKNIIDGRKYNVREFREYLREEVNFNFMIRSLRTEYSLDLMNVKGLSLDDKVWATRDSEPIYLSLRSSKCCSPIRFGQRESKMFHYQNIKRQMKIAWYFRNQLLLIFLSFLYPIVVIVLAILYLMYGIISLDEKM